MTSTIYLILLLLTLTLSSCGGGEHSATNTGSASFGLRFEQATAPAAMKLAPSMAPADICSSYGIDSISGTVYNSSNSIIATGGPWACSAHQGTINNIPPGSNLRITIKGTVSGTVVWQGETTGATINAGQDTNVGSIPMTYTGSDTTPPTVSAATPTGTNVPITSPITVTFSEAMASTTIDATTFTLKNGSVAVSGSVSYNTTTKAATFTPTSSLSYSTTYTATVTTDVTDMAANKMLSLYTWSFTTEAPPGSAPTAPTGVTATAADKQVTISWTAVSGASSYNVYWSTTTGVTTANGTLTTGATSPYTHTALTNGTTYYYVVTAINSYGESTVSSQVSATPSVGIVLDTTAPANTTAANFINSVASSASSTAVTLAISATDAVGVTAYYVSETSTTPSASASGWTAITSTTAYSASVSFTLSSGDGTKTVYVWFKDAAGYVSATVSDAIILSAVTTDVTAPTNTTASNFINNGASESNSISVTLSISATDNVAVTGYYVSENSITPSASAVGWTSIVTVTNYSSSVTYTLSNDNGIKTVYVWFKDAAGNVSTVASDSITYKAWAISTIDSIGDVGWFASMVLDSNNKAHISYSDVTNQVLKYATNESGSWATSIADNSGGSYSSIAIDSNNKPHIIYLNSGVNDLRYATNASGVWVVASLMSSATQIWGPSITIDLNNKLHISFYNDSGIKYLTNVSGAWSSSTVDTGNFTRSTATERWTTSIATDLNNKVHISYAHSPDGFKYANNTSGAWAVATLDSVAAYYNSMEIDINGKAHISSLTSVGDGNYATNASGSWVITRIGGGNNDTYSSLALDSNDKVHIIYGLNIYVTNVTGIWVYSSVPETGWYSSMDIDSNNKIHISYFDSANRDLKYATNQ